MLGRGRARKSKKKSKKGFIAKKRNVAKITEAEARVQKEIATGTLLRMDKSCFTIYLPNPKKFDVINVIVRPPPPDDDQASYYHGGEYGFEITISKGQGGYPYREPEIKMLPDYKIYHPNIAWGGEVCLNLRKGHWRANMGLKYVCTAILHVLLNPNPLDPQEGKLPTDIAKIMRDNKAEFVKQAERAMRGDNLSVNGSSYKFPTKSDLAAISKKALAGDVLILNTAGRGK